MTAALVLVGLWLLWAAAVVLAHPVFLYPFPTDPVRLAGAELQVIEGADGTPVHLYVAGPEVAEGTPTILYFMGNVGSLTLFAGVIEAHVAAGHRVAALQYRGGGGTPGRPRETELKADALAAFDAVAGEGSVILRGYSLGAALAMHVAAERPAAGVILEAPFARACELIAAQSLTPACAMPGIDRWDSIAIAARVDEPVLILHGAADRLIPPRHGRRLAQALRAAGARVRLVEIAGAGHNDLPAAPRTARAIGAFVARHGVPR